MFWHVYTGMFILSCLISVYLYMFHRCSPDMSSGQEMTSVQQKILLRVSMFEMSWWGSLEVKRFFCSCRLWAIQFADSYIALRFAHEKTDENFADRHSCSLAVHQLTMFDTGKRHMIPTWHDWEHVFGSFAFFSLLCMTYVCNMMLFGFHIRHASCPYVK